MKYSLLDDGSNETALISCNPGLHYILESAVSTDKIIKTSNFKSKDDQFSGEKIITLWDKSFIEYSKKQISFEKVRVIAHKLNTFTYGVYKLQGLRVNSFKGKYLTTTAIQLL